MFSSSRGTTTDDDGAAVTANFITCFHYVLLFPGHINQQNSNSSFFAVSRSRRVLIANESCANLHILCRQQRNGEFIHLIEKRYEETLLFLHYSRKCTRSTVGLQIIIAIPGLALFSRQFNFIRKREV